MFTIDEEGSCFVVVEEYAIFEKKILLKSLKKSNYMIE